VYNDYISAIYHMTGAKHSGVDGTYHTSKALPKRKTQCGIGMCFTRKMSRFAQQKQHMNVQFVVI
jgi:hypothetical protein